ncbi:MAG TPA: TonB-dependent receptor [Ferruginibacter sp.]|nr:TonB-dependent receptor [Ferruginibacter sp.]HMP20733.1 TonB-dependent receptor [Ferruginibacter sp.]
MRLLNVLLLAGLVFLSASSFAQSVQLSGKVLNSRNEPLLSASITITPSSKKVITDAEGKFVVTLEPGTKYTFTISHVGYDAKTITEIQATRGQDNYLDVVLEESSKNKLTEVTVRSAPRRQENTSALLAFQKGNTALSSVLAADFIRRTPDKNTGEVLRRVSGTSIQDNKFVIVRGLGDRYNSAYINGAPLPSSEPDKKAFSFDVIPSALIDNIIINKTATPDLTGEFAGGLVQIQTKDIPVSSQLMIGASVGYNTQTRFRDFTSNERGATDALGFDDRRSLPAAYPTKYLDYSKLSAAEKVAVTQSFRDDVYREVQSQATPIQTYNLTWANVARKNNGSQFGTVIGLTYRHSKLLYSATKTLYEKGATGQAFFDYTDEQNKYNVNWGGVANFAWSYKKHKIAFKNLFNQLFEDNYYTRTGINTENLQDVQMRSSVLNQRSLYASQLEGTHQVTRKDIKLTWNLNYSMNLKNQPDLRVQTYGKSIGINEPFRINLRGNNTNRFTSNLTDHAFGYNVSAAVPFEMGGKKQLFKIGGAATARIRDFKAFIFGFTEPNNAALNSLPFDQIFLRQNMNENGFMISTDLQNAQDKYYGASVLSAGYLMFDNKLSDKIRLVWGSRFENFEQFMKSNTQGTDKAQIVNTDKFDVLPSMNLTFSPGSKTNIRLGASRTVARPEFREIAPFTFFDFEQIASTAGNPDLKRSSILNADIRYEWYPKAGEVLSFGAFYKNFADPIELRLNSASVATRRQYQFQNAEKATLFGLEAEFRKNLSFLSANAGWLENLYFNGNLSMIFSEVALGNVDVDGNKLPPTTRPLQGQSPYLINAGFQYDGKKGTNFSLLYNRIGERLVLVGNDDFGDIYEVPRHLLDFQVSQKVLDKKGEIRLTVSDIFNQHVAAFENRDDKRTYNAATDKYFTRYKPGTTITIGFNYNFDLKK